jgi:hypothetical protein
MHAVAASHGRRWLRPSGRWTPVSRKTDAEIVVSTTLDLPSLAELTARINTIRDTL